MAALARLACALAAAAMLTALAAPAGAALSTFSAWSGDQGASGSLLEDGSLYRLDANAAAVRLITLGPLEYILEWVNYADGVAAYLIDHHVANDGMDCVYGDPDQNPRSSLVCYCIKLEWDCYDTYTTEWVCYASAGPDVEKQVGLVCMPPRSKVLQ